MATTQLSADNVAKFHISEAGFGAILEGPKSGDKDRLYTHNAMRKTAATGVAIGLGIVAALAAFDKSPSFLQNKSSRAL